MWNESNEEIPSVIIVESENGDVFIVESKEEKPQVDRILKTNKSPSKSPRSTRKKPAGKKEKQQASAIVPKLEIKDEIEEEAEEIIEEYLDECFEDNDETLPLPFVDPNINQTVITIVEMKSEQELQIEDINDHFKTYKIVPAILDHQYMTQDQETFDGKFSSDEIDEVSEEEFVMKTKIKVEKENTIKVQRHKLRQLTGKSACKYCDTIFKSKDTLKMHFCQYLQCDPKNFICRVCGKELSKKTFSNHLHETLSCQYCGKDFVNPRNLKVHLQTFHKDEKFIPPNSPNLSVFEQFQNQDETMEPVLDEETGLIITTKVPKKKYPRKTGRFECDLCGRLFTTVRSLQIHMHLHTNTPRYVCQTCGEKYTTHSGITKHPCFNKKRRRPEVDFRIFDVRHCKFCGLSFPCLEENKAHACEFQFSEDPKMFRCRFCYIDMSKNSYNKHMRRHLEPNKEWVCGFCDKKLSDEASLNVHLTTHTGDKPFKCPYENCEQSFINKQLLTRHSRFHGADIPVHVCKVCNKEVASKYHLKNHLKIHADTAECQLCNMEFYSKDELKEHYAKSHMPYPCSSCDKSFTLPRYLKMHEKLHTPSEPKPHKCEFCQGTKSFSKLALLLNHVFKVHNEMFDEWKRCRPEIFK